VPTKPEVVAFDMIETVFSLEIMRERFVPLGLPESALEAWFAAGLRDAFALAITDQFAPFRSVLKGSLATLLARHQLPFDSQQAGFVLDGMKSLKPHPDAVQAFELLRDAGFRILALSNSAKSATEALLQGGGLASYVERVLSVEEVRFSKPRREVYLYAAKAAGVAPGQLALIATHAWDIHGAKAAGLFTGFVARGQPYPEVMLKPDVRGEELTNVAQALVSLA
jgi:2-haloacid dehalogenase